MTNLQEAVKDLLTRIQNLETITSGGRSGSDDISAENQWHIDIMPEDLQDATGARAGRHSRVDDTRCCGVSKISLNYQRNFKFCR